MSELSTQSKFAQWKRPLIGGLLSALTAYICYELAFIIRLGGDFLCLGLHFLSNGFFLQTNLTTL